MARKFIDSNALLYIFTKIKNTFVAKVDGKGLSTHDLTDELKNKLDGIQAGAEANVQPDWTATEGDSMILNKPVIPTKTSQISNDSGFITIDQVPEGAAASTTAPLMAGVASTGTEAGFARGDHVHPSDTSRVPITRKINNKPLNADVTLGAGDVGAVPTDRTVNGHALTENIEITVEDLNAVPSARKVNGHELSSDVNLGANDVGAVPTTRTVNGKALDKNITITNEDLGAVPTTRTVNGHALSEDITLGAGDVNAVPTTRKVNGKALSGDISLGAGDVNAVPTERKVNGQALSADITLDAAAVGAIATSAKGQAGGVATLDENGQVPSSQLPSYVDDVVEGYYHDGAFYSDESHAAQITGESNKIYVDLASNLSYRFSGTTYIQITSSDMVAITNAEIDDLFAAA